MSGSFITGRAACELAIIAGRLRGQAKRHHEVRMPCPIGQKERIVTKSVVKLPMGGGPAGKGIVLPDLSLIDGLEQRAQSLPGLLRNLELGKALNKMV